MEAEGDQGIAVLDDNGEMVAAPGLLVLELADRLDKGALPLAGLPQSDCTFLQTALARLVGVLFADAWAARRVDTDCAQRSGSCGDPGRPSWSAHPA